MIKIGRLVCQAALIGSLVSCGKGQMSETEPTLSSIPEPAIGYRIYQLPRSTVHTLRIPKNAGYIVKVASSPAPDTLASFAEKYAASAVLNGGFFDAVNGKTTSYIIEDGKTVGDPKLNERLMDNPSLAPYLKQILGRAEFRIYLCGNTTRYAIAPHDEPVPPGCMLTSALGGGPRLLPDITAQTEGFFFREGGRIVRDPLGMEATNARTALGITKGGDLLWVMVAQKPNSLPDSGLSLPQLAHFLKTLGVQEAINLDGGSSSSLYHEGKTYHGKLDKDGKPVKRRVKSVLILQENEQFARFKKI